MEEIIQLNDILKTEISKPIRDNISINYTLNNLAKAFNYQYKHNKNVLSDYLMAGLYEKLKETHYLFKCMNPHNLITNGNKYLNAFRNITNFYDYSVFTLIDNGVCSVCNGKYLWYNKSHHNKSNKHLKKLEEIKII